MIVFVGPGVGHLTDLVLPGVGGRGSLNPSLPDMEIFDCRLGRDRTYVSHTSFMRRMVWNDLEIMEANENKRKLGGFHCFVFKFCLF